MAALLALPLAVFIVSIGAAIELADPSTQHPLLANVFSSKDHQQPFERALVPSVLAGEEITVPQSAQTADKPRGAREAAPLQGGSEEAAEFSETAAQPQHVASTEHEAAAPQREVPQAPSQPQVWEHRAPATVAVPDLAGMTVAEAKTALAEIGLILKVSSYAKSETLPEGVILSQDTPSGYQARPGATVAVVVSSGPPPVSQSPKPKGVEPSDALEVNVPEVKVPEIEMPEVKVRGVKIPSVKVPQSAPV